MIRTYSGLLKSFYLICCCCLVTSVVSDSVQPHGLQPARLLCPWGFSMQEYWSGLPCPPPWDLPDSRMEPRSSTLQADSLPSDLLLLTICLVCLWYLMSQNCHIFLSFFLTKIMFGHFHKLNVVFTLLRRQVNHYVYRYFIQNIFSGLILISYFSYHRNNQISLSVALFLRTLI